MAHRAVRLAIATKILIVGLELWGGIVGNSAAVLADAAHSFSDALASLVVWIGLRVAGRPPDKTHPYGHGKAESIVAKLAAMFLFAFAAGMIYRAAKGLAAGEEAERPQAVAFWTALLAILALEGLYQYMSRLAQQIGSAALTAEAWHHRADALTSVVALAGVAGSLVDPRLHFLDHVAAIVVALFIMWVSVKIFRRTWRDLMDTMLPAHEIEQVRNLALQIEGALGVETILARRSGLDVLVDIHVEVDPKMTVEAAHRIAQKVRDHVREELPSVKSVMVHIEPYFPNDH